jgi:nucleoside-diphosphate-sugar epimerase
MPTVFVTGGTGFLGRHLVPALCRAGYTQRVLTRNPAAHPWLKEYPRLETVVGDLQDATRVEQAAAGCDYIIHAAGLFSMWHEAGDFHATNVNGTENIMCAAVKHKVQRVLYISTAAVIGQPIPGRLIDEEHPANPADPYQRSKLEAEQVVQRYHQEQGIATVILRPGAFYGPMGDYAFNRLFFTDPMRGILMQMDGGRYLMFPAYIGDVADAVVLALTKGRDGELYNICGDWISHRAAFDIVCQEAHIRWFRLNIPGFVGINFARFLTAIAHITHQEPFYPMGLRSYVFNDWRVTSEKARRELGFVPTDFREGVRRTIAWYKAGKPDSLPELACNTTTDS